MVPKELQEYSESNSVWVHLVIAILSVNQYSLEKTYLIKEDLAAVGLFNPENLKRWTHSTIAEQLQDGNCNRGEFMTNLFSERLEALGKLIQQNGIQKCEMILSSNDIEAIRNFLTPVKGIGPKVLRNFFILQNLEV